MGPYYYRNIIMKDSLRFWNMCGHKIQYKSKKSAENSLRTIKKTGKIIPQDAHAYKCDYGYHWHLGHSNRYA